MQATTVKNSEDYRTSRIGVATSPETHLKISTLAAISGLPVNSLINNLIEQAIEENAEVIEQALQMRAKLKERKSQ